MKWSARDERVGREARPWVLRQDVQAQCACRHSSTFWIELLRHGQLEKELKGVQWGSHGDKKGRFVEDAIWINWKKRFEAVRLAERNLNLSKWQDPKILRRSGIRYNDRAMYSLYRLIAHSNRLVVSHNLCSLCSRSMDRNTREYHIALQ